MNIFASPHFDDIVRFARLGEPILQFDGENFTGFTAIRVLDSLLLLGCSGERNANGASQTSA